MINPSKICKFLELYLNKDQIEKLHDFEEECMDELSRAKEAAKVKSTEERIKRTAERYLMNFGNC